MLVWSWVSECSQARDDDAFILVSVDMQVGCAVRTDRELKNLVHGAHGAPYVLLFLPTQ